jgi:hypothetical protein
MNRYIKKALSLMLFYLIAYFIIVTFYSFLPLGAFDKIDSFSQKLVTTISSISFGHLSVDDVRLGLGKIGGTALNDLLHKIIAMCMIFLGVYSLGLALKRHPDSVKKFFRIKRTVHIVQLEKEKALIAERKKTKWLALIFSITFFVGGCFALYYFKVSDLLLQFISKYF